MTAAPREPDQRSDDERDRWVRPSNWSRPTPRRRYRLLVIGAGTAGLVSAAGAAGLGAKVALVERHRMGGDCLNTGCVPSKALIASARRARSVRGAAEFGVTGGEGQVDFAAVMARMRRLRAAIAPHDSAERFRGLGVDVFFGAARFVGPDCVRLDDGTELRFRKAIIATGASPFLPPIPGLEAVEPLTSEHLFDLNELPSRLLVIGGGPIGCEMAQTFATFGAAVTLIEGGARILSRDDADAAAMVAAAMTRDGVEIRLGSRVVAIERRGDERTAIVEKNGERFTIPFDRVLVATGRRPNVAGLGLEEAGVAFDPQRGILVDDRLRSSNRRIFAAGDVASPLQFTHAADFLARSAIRNALFFGRASASGLIVPRCTYTSPEVASVGRSADQAAADGIKVQTFEIPFATVDRAQLDGETEGFVRVVCRAGSDRLLGATVVGENAGDLIAPLVLALQQRIGLGRIGATIHSYPTRAEAIRRLGDAYSRTRLTPMVKRLFRFWLGGND
ncbi:MAG TPA: mercuric reductase [Pirellulaceae bacterium]|nr:mercuric reductase [Pirellulaceae bacterium]